MTDYGRSVAKGVVLVLAGHVLMACFLTALAFGLPTGGSFAFLIALFNPGATQLLYVVPMYWKARRNQDAGRQVGILIAAALTILLNGACWAFNW